MRLHVEQVIRRGSVAALVLFSSLLCFAQSDAALAKVVPPPVPKAKEVLPRLRGNQKEIEALTRNYICTKDVIVEKLDKNGRVKDTERKRYETFFVENVPVDRLVEKDGKPLSDSDQRKEEERVQKRIKEIGERRAKMEKKSAEGNGDEDEDDAQVSLVRVLDSQNFSDGRRITINGRELYAYDFKPNPDFKPKTKEEKIAHKLAGTLAIDPQALQIVRAELRLLEAFRFGAGILGSVKEGTQFVIEQQRINNEIWLPRTVNVDLAARVVFAGVRQRITNEYSNYRKFRSESKIVEGAAVEVAEPR